MQQTVDPHLCSRPMACALSRPYRRGESRRSARAAMLSEVKDA